jgi:F-type H+-transporting ATPase subunit a
LDVLATSVLGAVEYGGPWEVPPIGELFNFRPLPGLEALGVDRVVLMLLLSTLMICAFFYAATARSRIVPGRLQAAAEGIVVFVRDQIALDIIGPKGRRYAPLLTCFFLFILVNNLFKLTPGIMFPPTGHIAIPALLAVIAWLVYLGAGIAEHGFLGYLKQTCVPDAPKGLLVILVPIEFLSNILLRPFTLAVRLFANMVAGHMLVVITLITIHAFLTFGPGLPVGLFALAVSPLVFGFELFIIVLQAYIFTLLAAVYIGASVSHEH